MNTLTLLSRVVTKSKTILRAARGSQTARSQATKLFARAYTTKAAQKAANLNEVHKDQVWTLPADFYKDPKVNFLNFKKCGLTFPRLIRRLNRANN